MTEETKAPTEALDMSRRPTAEELKTALAHEPTPRVKAEHLRVTGKEYPYGPKKPPVARKPPPKKPTAKVDAPAKIPGIILRVADDLVIRHTPLGRGRWRCEDEATQTSYEGAGGIVGAHDGTYIEVAAMMVNQFDHLPYVVDPYVPPKVIGKDGE